MERVKEIRICLYDSGAAAVYVLSGDTWRRRDFAENESIGDVRQYVDGSEPVAFRSWLPCVFPLGDPVPNNAIDDPLGALADHERRLESIEKFLVLPAA